MSVILVAYTHLDTHTHTHTHANSTDHIIPSVVAYNKSILVQGAPHAYAAYFRCVYLTPSAVAVLAIKN